MDSLADIPRVSNMCCYAFEKMANGMAEDQAMSNTMTPFYGELL